MEMKGCILYYFLVNLDKIIAVVYILKKKDKINHQLQLNINFKYPLKCYAISISFTLG